MIGTVRNSGDPIKLNNVQLSGFAGENASPGQTIKVLTRGAITSDQPEFYPLANSFGDMTAHLVQLSGVHVTLERYSTILLIIHGDKRLTQN
jgi:hypothetical protein